MLSVIEGKRKLTHLLNAWGVPRPVVGRHLLTGTSFTTTVYVKAESSSNVRYCLLEIRGEKVKQLEGID